MYSAFVAAIALLSSQPAVAGSYEPPYVFQESLTPTRDLRETVALLSAAVAARNAEVIAEHLPRGIVAVSSTLALDVPRLAEVVTLPAEPRTRVRSLSALVGGGMDLATVDNSATPQLMDDVAYRFLAEALSPPFAWGVDPLVPDAICTSAAYQFDPYAVTGAASGVPGVSTSEMVTVALPTPLTTAPRADGKDAGTAEAGRLYFVDTGADAAEGWMAIRTPRGRRAFLPAEDALSPYASGLCFREAENTWLIIGVVGTAGP